MNLPRCDRHKDRATMPACSTCKRIEVEADIVTRTVDALLAAGFILAVDNGGDDYEVDRTNDRAALLAGLMLTDDERLIVFRQYSADRIGWVYFVYGNDGWDVINDYSTNLDEVLAAVTDYCQTLEP